MTRNVVAIIPARGTSKRLPRKNIYPLFGRPLLQWSIEALRRSKSVPAENIYVSTEDAEVKDLAIKLGAKVIDRPPELAEDSVWTQEVLKHAVRELEGQGKKSDIVVRVQANSPQIEAEKIDEAITQLLTHDRWEVFTVDRNGIEDAAVHVLKRDVVFQKAFSVYKGIVRTNYIDVHTLADIRQIEAAKIREIEEQSDQYLNDLQGYFRKKTWRSLVPARWQSDPFSLWGWQTKIPLHRRWELILEQCDSLRTFLARPDAYERATHMAVLDLGCGFGMYWPILRLYGFKTFVGVDLFDKRLPQFYYEAAKRYVSHFCPDCRTQLIMDDVRNLAAHQLITDRFGIVFNVATASTKAGSSGIPHSLFAQIVRQYGTPECLAVHVEKAH